MQKEFTIQHKRNSLTWTFGEVPVVERTRVRASAAGTTSSTRHTRTFPGVRAVVAPAATGIRSASGARRVETAPFPAGLCGTASGVYRRPLATLPIWKTSRVCILVYAFGLVLTPDTIGFRAIAARRVFHAWTAARIHGQTLCLDRAVQHAHLFKISMRLIFTCSIVICDKIVARNIINIKYGILIKIYIYNYSLSGIFRKKLFVMNIFRHPVQPVKWQNMLSHAPPEFSTAVCNDRVRWTTTTCNADCWSKRGTCAVADTRCRCSDRNDPVL